MTHNEVEVLNVKIERLEKKLLEVSDLFNDIAMPYQVCFTFIILKLGPLIMFYFFIFLSLFQFFLLFYLFLF